MTADDRPRSRWIAVVVIAAATLALGLAGGGAGHLDGDAAAYSAQARAGDLSERTVHLGYLLLARAIAGPAGEATPRALDALAALAIAGGAVAAGARGWRAAAVFAAIALERAPFAEVDPLWVALVAGAAAIPGPAPAGILAGAAAAVSPVAILALPWAWSAGGGGRGRALALAAGVGAAVLALTIASGGGWWWGDRGLLSGPGPRPLRAAGEWAPALAPLLPLGLLAGRKSVTPFLWTLLLLLAPPDVPTWLVGALALAPAVEAIAPRIRPSLRPLLPAFLVGLGLLGLVREVRLHRSVAAEDAAIRAAIAAMGPADGLVATWSWGARASVLAAGDPYAIPWRVPGDPVRGQAAWCDRTFDRVLLLPPSLRVAGIGPVMADPSGATWARGDDPAWTSLPGCR